MQQNTSLPYLWSNKKVVYLTYIQKKRLVYLTYSYTNKRLLIILMSKHFSPIIKHPTLDPTSAPVLPQPEK